METINLLRLQNFPIYEQLLIEEALLRADTENWCLINHGTPPAIVMGISGKPEQLVDQIALDKANIPLIQRFSGGGTVFVDNNTTFVTLICNTLEGLPNFPCRILKWTEELYKPAFRDFSLQENDYILGDRKFGGNAQYICKNRWLHHTSLLWDYDLQSMELLLYPPKAPDYRKKRSHEEFLCPLHPHFDSRKGLEEALLEAIGQRFTLVEKELADIEGIKPHRVGTKKLLKGG